MGGRGGGSSIASKAAAPSAAPAAAPASVETRIRNWYLEARRYEGDWLPLADLRDALGDLTREQQDDALRSMATKPGVHIIVWDNLKALSQRDHQASFRFGGQDNHAIRIES